MPRDTSSRSLEGHRVTFQDGLRRTLTLYRYTTPFTSWDDMGRREAGFRTPAPDFVAPLMEATSYVDTRLERRRPDLSYVPDNPRVPVGDASFLHEIRAYVRPGMAGRVLRLVGELNDLRERHDTRNAVLVSSSVVASDGPLVTIVFFARDAADYHRQVQDEGRVIGDDFSSIIDQINALCRRVESVHYTIRRDLFYLPED